jgi:hypothetical protein
MEQQGFVRGVGALAKCSQQEGLGKDVGDDGRNALVRARQEVMQVSDQRTGSVRAGEAEESHSLRQHVQGLGVGEAGAKGGKGGGMFEQALG